ncbi:MAG: TerD family protein [archaeon]|nr:TerD family protein [archaeon]
MKSVDLMWIKFTFLRGNDLLAADMNGKSDPYALIPNGQTGFLNFPSNKGFKTDPKKDTLNPIWNKSFDICVAPDYCSSIRIEVYDHDAIGSDDFLGYNNYNMEYLKQIDRTKYFLKEDTLELGITKTDKKTNKESTERHGNISIKVEYFPEEPKESSGVKSSSSDIQPMENLNPLQPGTWLPIKESEVFVGLGWDFTEGNTFDLDVSITAFDGKNNAVEKPVYFNNKTGLGESIIHQGNNKTGEGEGDDEVISVKLSQIPKHVESLAVTVHSSKGQSIIEAKSGYIRVYTKGRELGKYILSRTKDCVGLLLGLFERNKNNGEWFFSVMADPIEGKIVTNSIDSLKELLGGYSMSFSSVNSPKPIHPFPNEILFKSGTWIEIKNANTYIGLGWDIVRGHTYDLDTGIILFDEADNILDIIYHKNPKSKDGSVYHMGDNKTGAGEGDDEIMGINFLKIAPNIMSMAVVLNSFKGNTLKGVKSGFIRLFDSNGPIGCYLIGEGKDSTGLLLGLFRRDISGRFLFQATIEPISGVTAPESANEVQCLLYNYQLADQIQSEKEMKEEQERKEREKEVKNNNPIPEGVQSVDPEKP